MDKPGKKKVKTIQNILKSQISQVKESMEYTTVICTNNEKREEKERKKMRTKLSKNTPSMMRNEIH